MRIGFTFIICLSFSTLYGMKSETNEISHNKQNWPPPTKTQIEQLSSYFDFSIPNGITEKSNLDAIIDYKGQGYQEKLKLLSGFNKPLFEALASLYHEKFNNLDTILDGTTIWGAYSTKLLLQAGANPNAISGPNKMTFLMNLATFGNLETCNFMIENKATNVNQVDINNMTALSYAVYDWKNPASVVLSLLIGGANPNILIQRKDWPGPEHIDEYNKTWDIPIFYPKFFNGFTMLDMYIIKAINEWFFLKVIDPSIHHINRAARIDQLNTIIYIFQQYKGET